MATPREHMIANLAHAFSVAGGVAVDVVLDGVPLRAIVEPLDLVAGGFDGSAVRSQAVWLMKGALPVLPRPDYRLALDGQEWTVLRSDPTGLLDVIYLVANE